MKRFRVGPRDTTYRLSLDLKGEFSKLPASDCDSQEIVPSRGIGKGEVDDEVAIPVSRNLDVRAERASAVVRVRSLHIYGKGIDSSVTSDAQIQD